MKSRRGKGWDSGGGSWMPRRGRYRGGGRDRREKKPGFLCGGVNFVLCFVLEEEKKF